MFYTVYRVTNTINGKFYIGQHRTTNPHDSYMGSGKILRHAFEKYGKTVFIKDVLFVFDNPEDMIAKERELVDEAFIARRDTYNIAPGGLGGFDYINDNRLTAPGKPFSEWSKEELAATAKLSRGARGTVWMCLEGNPDRRVPKDQVDMYLELGYKYGRLSGSKKRRTTICSS